MGFSAACYFGQLRASNYRGSSGRGIRRSWPLLSGTHETRFRISRRVLFILRPRLSQRFPPAPPPPRAGKRCHTSLPISLRPGRGRQGFVERVRADIPL